MNLNASEKMIEIIREEKITPPTHPLQDDISGTESRIEINQRVF